MKMKEKIRKEYLRRTRKFLETKFCSRNLIKGINTWVISSDKILRTILKMDKGRTQTNRPEDKKVDDNDIDRLHLSRKKVEEDSSVWLHQYKDLTTTLKSAKKD